VKKISIATPISHLFKDRHIADEIIQHSDCLELRDQSLGKDFPRQFLFHCDVNIIHEWDDQTKASIQNILSLTPELKVISFHMAVSCNAPVLQGKMYISGGKPYTRNEMLSHGSKNIEWLRSFMPTGLRIAVENNNYYPDPAYNIVTDPDFISEMVRNNQVFFLFDIAHAEVTAINRSISYQEYCRLLPLTFAIQLHVCRMATDEEGMAYDAHDPPDEVVMSKVDDLICRYPIEYLTLEYYKDKDKLIEMLRSLKKTYQ
jgi:uncharacterized protein (UPF0276 family)